MKKLLLALVIISLGCSAQPLWKKKSSNVNWAKWVNSSKSFLLDDSTTSADSMFSMAFPLSTNNQDFSGALSFTLKVDTIAIPGNDNDWILTFYPVYYWGTVGKVIGDTLTWTLASNTATTTKTILGANDGNVYFWVSDPTLGIEQVPIDACGIMMKWADTLSVRVMQDLGSH